MIETALAKYQIVYFPRVSIPLPDESTKFILSPSLHTIRRLMTLSACGAKWASLLVLLLRPQSDLDFLRCPCYTLYP
jgi:hypothetical protein